MTTKAKSARVLVDRLRYEQDMRDLSDYRGWDLGNFRRHKCGRLVPEGYLCSCEQGR